MSIWALEYQISKPLLIWSALSLSFGSVVLLPEGFWQGFALQCLVWGLIDALIAIFGWQSAKRKRIKGAHEQAEAKSLRKLLFLNAGLDLIYILIGLIILSVWGERGAFTLGNAYGIILQGSFLLLFDFFYGFKVHNHLINFQKKDTCA